MTKRMPNFSAQELEALTDAVILKNDVLFSRLSDVITTKRKTRAWASVATAVNSVGGNNRDYKDIRRKWTVHLSEVKKKASAIDRSQRQTGGGERDVDELSVTEQKVLSAIPNESVYGITGGIYTEDTQKLGAAVIHAMGDSDDDADGDSVSVHSALSQSSTVTEPSVDIEPSGKRHLTPASGSKPSVTSKRMKENDGFSLLEIEKERIGLEKERLFVDQERLTTEKALVDSVNNLVDSVNILVRVQTEILNLKKERYSGAASSSRLLGYNL